MEKKKKIVKLKTICILEFCFIEKLILRETEFFLMHRKVLVEIFANRGRFKNQIIRNS